MRRIVGDLELNLGVAIAKVAGITVWEKAKKKIIGRGLIDRVFSR
jgi:hypothetical protein